MNIDTYFESLILDAVVQADAPLHEALVRSNVYRTINDSYERALAQLVIDGKLLYANGEYSMAPASVVQAAKPAEEPVAADAIELETVKSEDAEGESVGDEDIDGAVVDDENVESEEAAPEAVEADIVEPDAVECDTAEPEAVEVAADEPVTAEPVKLEGSAGDATEAEAVEPVAEEPEAVEPVAEEPEAVEPVAEGPEAVESVTPEDSASKACGPISLRADSTLARLKVNGRSWPIPVAVGVSYDKKPVDGLSLMGYELPAESVATAEQPAEQQEPVRAEQREPVQPRNHAVFRAAAADYFLLG